MTFLHLVIVSNTGAPIGTTVCLKGLCMSIYLCAWTYDLVIEYSFIFYLKRLNIYLVNLIQFQVMNELIGLRHVAQGCQQRQQIP